MYFCEHSLSLAFEPSRHLRSQAQRDLLVCSISYLEYFNLLRPPLLEGVRARAVLFETGEKKTAFKKKAQTCRNSGEYAFQLVKEIEYREIC